MNPDGPGKPGPFNFKLILIISLIDHSYNSMKIKISQLKKIIKEAVMTSQGYNLDDYDSPEEIEAEIRNDERDPIWDEEQAAKRDALDAQIDDDDVGEYSDEHLASIMRKYGKSEV